LSHKVGWDVFSLMTTVYIKHIYQQIELLGKHFSMETIIAFIQQFKSKLRLNFYFYYKLLPDFWPTILFICDLFSLLKYFTSYTNIWLLLSIPCSICKVSGSWDEHAEGSREIKTLFLHITLPRKPLKLCFGDVCLLTMSFSETGEFSWLVR
jgi:hypothetical protein